MRETFVRRQRERPQRVVSENYVRVNGDAARASHRSTAVSQNLKNRGADGCGEAGLRGRFARVLAVPQ